MGGSPHIFVDQPELAKTLTVRGVRADDDSDYARLISLVMAAQFDVDLLRERRKRWSQKYWFDRVADLGGKVVGILEFIQSGKPGTATARIIVDPEFRRRGVGTALLGEMRSNPEFAARKVFCEARDNDPGSIAFAEAAGFRKRGHMFESLLVPDSFRLEAFQSHIDRVLDSGIRIATLKELGDTEENRYKLWEIEHVTDFDIPGIDMDETTSWEDAQKSWFSASWYNPAGEFVALDGDKWVGLSGVAELSPGIFYVQHTCTLKEYRGRGIATALKALATENATQRKARVLKTNNHDGNKVMLSINQKFGFVPQPGWIEMVREPFKEKEL